MTERWQWRVWTKRSMETSAKATALEPIPDHHLRVPCYCEENVWRLAYRKVNQQIHADGKRARYYVAFVSNPSKCVCYFHQRASESPSRPVFWDYHVILLEHSTSTSEEEREEGKEEVLVYDIDSRLPYPSPISDYLDACFPDLSDPRNAQHKEQLSRMAPRFRVVEAETFLNCFASNRSHMWDDEKQAWSAPPPLYDCIQPQTLPSTSSETTSHGISAKAKTRSNAFPQFHDLEHNLMDFVDTEHNIKHEKLGTVLTMAQLRQYFQCI